jgi:hypothetical protein
MKIEKRLFIIFNPTHYINSVEYIDYLNINGTNHLLVVSEFVEAIKELIENHGSNLWASIYVEDIKKYKTPSSHWQTWRLMYKLINETYLKIFPDELILGNIGDPLLYSIALKASKRIRFVALDDGIPSINILRTRNANRFFFKYHILSFRYTIRLFLASNHFLFFCSQPKKIVFFTMFKLDGAIRDICIFNQYSYLKSKICSKIENNLAYFVGTQIVDKGIVSKNTYLNSLKSIVNELKKEVKNVYYLPHRAESDFMMNEIQRILPIKKINVPLEFAFLSNSSPKIIAGNFSSALFTLSRLYNKVEIRSYVFNENLILGSKIETKQDIINIQDELCKDPFIKSFKLDKID